MIQNWPKRKNASFRKRFLQYNKLNYSVGLMFIRDFSPVLEESLFLKASFFLFRRNPTVSP